MKFLFQLIFTTSVWASPCFPADLSLAPLGGYNSTYKYFFGGGIFFEFGEDVKWSNVFLGTTTKSFRIKDSLEWQLTPTEDWIVAKLNFDLGFVPYYGYGSQTRLEDAVYQDGRELDGDLLYRRNLAYHHQIEFGCRYYEWNLLRTKNEEINRELRDTSYKSLLLNYHYGDLGDRKQKDSGLRNLLSFENEYDPNRFYKFQVSQVLEVYFPWASIASRSLIGKLWSDSTEYMKYFSLGGSDRLRGYEKFRFVGDYMVLQQIELKTPYLFSGLRMVFFFDVGEATTESKIQYISYSYGTGIRFDLPPDRTEIIRIDIGKGKDDLSIVFDFGKTF